MSKELNLDERASLHPRPDMFYDIHGTFSISDSIEGSNIPNDFRKWLHEQFDKGGIPKYRSELTEEQIKLTQK
jgi:hypothetical protein